MNIRVYYEDTDAGGIVYHSNYLNYCERARSEHFFAQNILPHEGEGSGFVVHHIDASFLATSMLGDMLEVRTTLLKSRHTSVTLRQTIYKEESSVFSMEVVLVYLNRGKPAKIPLRLREAFEGFSA